MKNEVTTIKKGKIFNISLNISHLSFFSYRASYLLVKYSVNLMIFLYITLNLETFFQKCDFLQKFSLSLIFFFFFFEQDHLPLKSSKNVWFSDDFRGTEIN